MNERRIQLGLFIAYSVLLATVMVFKDIPMVRIGALMLDFGGTHEGPANLVPFKTILPYLRGDKGAIIAGVNLVGNILPLVPLGILAPYAFRNLGWKGALGLSVGMGLCIEAAQMVLRVGIFDIDDVILNALGVMIGYGSVVLLPRLLPGRRLLYAGIAAAVVCTGLAVQFYRSIPFPGGRGYEERPSPPRRNDGGGSAATGTDPCRGTGGTGEIVEVGARHITIRRRDGVLQEIGLTERTVIANAAGEASRSDLKAGARATIVSEVREEKGMTAVVIMLCLDASQVR